jgi:hypothetical protein
MDAKRDEWLAELRSIDARLSTTLESPVVMRQLGERKQVQSCAPYCIGGALFTRCHGAETGAPVVTGNAVRFSC